MAPNPLPGDARKDYEMLFARPLAQRSVEALQVDAELSLVFVVAGQQRSVDADETAANPPEHLIHDVDRWVRLPGVQEEGHVAFCLAEPRKEGLNVAVGPKDVILPALVRIRVVICGSKDLGVRLFSNHIMIARNQDARAPSRHL